MQAGERRFFWSGTCGSSRGGTTHPSSSLCRSPLNPPSGGGPQPLFPCGRGTVGGGFPQRWETRSGSARGVVGVPLVGYSALPPPYSFGDSPSVRRLPSQPPAPTPLVVDLLLECLMMGLRFICCHRRMGYRPSCLTGDKIASFCISRVTSDQVTCYLGRFAYFDAGGRGCRDQKGAAACMD